MACSCAGLMFLRAVMLPVMNWLANAGPRQEAQLVVGALQGAELAAGSERHLHLAALERLAHRRADADGDVLDVRVLQAG